MKVAVLCGGLSTERDVSLVTGEKVAGALSERGHRVILIDSVMGMKGDFEEKDPFSDGENLFKPGHNNAKITQKAPLLKELEGYAGNHRNFFGENVINVCRASDMVFLALHGAEGENGKVQAAFDLMGIRYTGAGYMGSALAMDKGISRRIFKTFDIPTAEGYVIFANDHMTQRMAPPFGYPCVVKPCCGGSSVGVSIAKDESSFKKALEEAFSYEERVVVEKYIEGREFSVGVVGKDAYPVIEIAPKEGFYDYKNKYTAGSAVETVPADIPETSSEKMREYALRAHEALGLQGYSRSDFLMDREGNIYCLETNTLPGMTDTSLLPQEAMAVGIGYGDLCELLIDVSSEKFIPKDLNPELVRERDYVMSIKDVAIACDGVLVNAKGSEDKGVRGASIDSRKVEEGMIFFAFKGENTDGHKYINSAFEKGAAVAVAEHEIDDPKGPMVIVPETGEALIQIASFHRKALDIPIIGVTGSVGKTSTKEMVSSVLSEKYKVQKTIGNFNNEIGMPLTILSITPEHEAAVIEMGISHFGEMGRMCRICRPDIFIITVIAPCHLEYLGDLDGVLKAKTEGIPTMKEGAPLILNGDDPELLKLSDVKRVTPIYYSISPQGRSLVYADKIELKGNEGSRFILHVGDEAGIAIIQLPGAHMVSNALAAACVGDLLHLTTEQIVNGLSKITPQITGRGQIFHVDGVTYVDDSYNANPSSMEAALSLLDQYEGTGRKIAILGDMGELGEKKEIYHMEVGQYAASLSLDQVYLLGELAEYIGRGLREKNAPFVHFDDMDDLYSAIKEYVKPGDAVLIKASHFMGFDKLVERLKA